MAKFMGYHKNQSAITKPGEATDHCWRYTYGAGGAVIAGAFTAVGNRYRWHLLQAIGLLEICDHRLIAAFRYHPNQAGGRAGPIPARVLGWQRQLA